MNKRSFLFLRHGETDWNLAGKFQGQNNVPLNKVGIKQARESVKRLQKFSIDKIYTSHLIRSEHTARLINEGLEYSCPIAEFMDLAECKSEVTAKMIYNGLGRKKYPSFSELEPSDESPEIFIQRVSNALKRILDEEHSKFPLVVAHGGTYWAICDFLGIPASDIHNCVPVYFNYVDPFWKQETILL